LPELILLSVVLGAYLLPWILATVREHPQREAICIVNRFSAGP